MTCKWSIVHHQHHTRLLSHRKGSVFTKPLTSSGQAIIDMLLPTPFHTALTSSEFGPHCFFTGMYTHNVPSISIQLDTRTLGTSASCT